MKPKSRLKEFKAGMGPTLKELKFTLGRIKKSPLSIIGISIIAFFAIIAVMAPILAPPVGLDPYTIFQDSFSTDPTPPGSPILDQYGGRPALQLGYKTHLFGTIEGMDIYYGVIWGTLVAFRIGIMVVALTLVIGLSIGCVSGYYGGVMDEIMMRFTDVIFAFPGLILAMAFVIALPLRWIIDIGFLAIAIIILIAVALVGHFGLKLSFAWSTLFGVLGTALLIVLQIVFEFPSIYVLRLWINDLDKVLIALIIVGWPGYTRVIRGEILKAKQEDYVEAARAVGCSDFRIMVKHILPNTIYPILIIASLDIGAIVLTAAALSFLGIGAPYGYTDWGQLISLSREKIWAGATNPLQNWYTFIIPGIFIATFTLGWNLLGDAFRDILDPTLRRR